MVILYKNGMGEVFMNPLAALLMSIADELKLIEKVEVRSGELTPYQGYIVIKILETAPAPMRSWRRDWALPRAP